MNPDDRYEQNDLLLIRRSCPYRSCHAGLFISAGVERCGFDARANAIIRAGDFNGNFVAEWSQFGHFQKFTRAT